MPNMFAYGPDYLFQAVTGVWRSYPSKSHVSKDLQDMGFGKWSHAWLSLLEDIDSSAGEFCGILSGDFVAQERSLLFTYGRPEES